ncbi:MAG: hypothetical protein M3437_13190 [Chloroflexota bacterium]|nr:hypothetical protein [Chloroflexota bacterium]
MRQEAVEAGMYESPGWNREFPKVQILTIEDLLDGKKPDVPPMRATFQRAERLRSGARHGQKAMFGSEQRS